MDYLLVLLLLVPTAGAIVGAFLPGKIARTWALLVSLGTLAIALIGALTMEWHLPGTVNPQLPFPERPEWGIGVPSIGFTFSLGVDTISMALVLLTVGLTPLAILASFESIKDRAKEYYAWMLALLVAMLGVFVSRDLLLFYVFFELTLIPMFFIIGIWGGPERRFAAGKFFLFTFTGSVFTLAGALYLGLHYNTFDIASLVHYAQYGDNTPGHFIAAALTSTQRFWIFMAFLAGFSVKVPLFPVHTWLPLAHTEAPTAGSVILAGVLLKLGTYGLLRLAIPIGMMDANGVAFPAMCRFIGALCVIGVIYGALVAWVQQDIKKLVAYSSVSHLGFCVLGLVAMNAIGMQGSVLYMINHGISTGALFLVIGTIYDRYHTRDINKLSGLSKRMPIMAFFFVFFTMSSIGLPGTNGFVSEFLTILGAFTSKTLGIRFGVLAATGIVLGAVYMLHMAARVLFGPLKVPGHEDDSHTQHSALATGHSSHDDPGDLTIREISFLAPLAIAVIVLGVLPTPFLDSILDPVNSILHQPLRGAPVAATVPPPSSKSPLTPGLRYSEDPDSIAQQSGSSEYLRPGVIVVNPLLNGTAQGRALSPIASTPTSD
jgi:NADH-quinone oxidoreductase subunit M